MLSAQRELLEVLLRSVQTQGLIDKMTCFRAMDLLDSSIDFPACFRYTVCAEQEATKYEHPQNTDGAAKRKNDL